MVTRVQNTGLVFLNRDDLDEDLYLPFVPTETNFERSTEWSVTSPPGMSGTFHAFSQGGEEKISFELFLNDYLAGSGDVIFGGYRESSSGEFLDVYGTQGALEWFDVVRNSRITADNKILPPAILLVTIAGRNMGEFKIRGFSGRIIKRKHRTSSEGKGNPQTVYVQLELIGHNNIPYPTRAFRW